MGQSKLLIFVTINFHVLVMECHDTAIIIHFLVSWEVPNFHGDLFSQQFLPRNNRKN